MLAARQQEKNFHAPWRQNNILTRFNRKLSKSKTRRISLGISSRIPKTKVKWVGFWPMRRTTRKAFALYVDLHTKMQAADGTMVKTARAAEKIAAEIQREQKEQYRELRDGNASNEQLDDKLTKAGEADTIIKWILQCRRQEKNFYIAGRQKICGPCRRACKRYPRSNPRFEVPVCRKTATRNRPITSLPLSWPISRPLIMWWHFEKSNCRPMHKW